MSEHESEHAKPLPYDCLKCKDEGVYLFKGPEDGNGWRYCDCKAGRAAEEEDRGSD
jgi:hypothetical protein